MPGLSADQARDRAHLRPLQRCRTCGKPATQELVNGVNATVGRYCDRCAGPALRRFKLNEGMER